jgi:hypothetical protein
LGVRFLVPGQPDGCRHLGIGGAFGAPSKVP